MEGDGDLTATEVNDPGWRAMLVTSRSRYTLLIQTTMRPYTLPQGSSPKTSPRGWHGREPTSLLPLMSVSDGHTSPLEGKDGNTQDKCTFTPRHPRIATSSKQTGLGACVTVMKEDDDECMEASLTPAKHLSNPNGLPSKFSLDRP